MKKKSKPNKKKYVLRGHIDMPKHEIPGMDPYKVELIDIVLELLVECNFDLEEFNKQIDSIPSTIEDPKEREWVIKNQISLFKETAKGVKEEAIRRGLIKE